MNNASPNAQNLYARLPEEALEAHQICDTLNAKGVACYVRCWHLDQTGWFVVNAQTYERMNFSARVSEMPKLSLRNRRLLEQAAAQQIPCGCYFCTRTWKAEEITEFSSDGTALCPECGTDAILVGVTDADALEAGVERWFCRVSNTQVEIA